MSKIISIIIPVRNEADNIEAFLQALQCYRHEAEIILVDGESNDKTYQLAAPYCDVQLTCKPSRAQQMNLGAKQATTAILLFLHADTYLPKDAIALIKASLKTKLWGRFNIKLSGSQAMFRIIETMINIRSRFNNIATGDQAIYVTKDLFNRVGMYENIPLMEDVALCKKLRAISPAACIKETAITSSRRWEKNGIWKTIFLMWQLRFAYAVGISPAKLVRKYYPS